jgi:hypothetical protein
VWMSVNRPLNSSSTRAVPKAPRDIEGEGVAESAVVVLPAAMLLLQEVVAERSMASTSSVY